MITRLVRLYFDRILRGLDRCNGREAAVQTAQLQRLLDYASTTDFGISHEFGRLYESVSPAELSKAFAEAVPMSEYEDLRPSIVRMIEGEPDILWPGICRRFAQSSGTSGGRSKYVPVTDDALSLNHYAGAAAGVALYLRSNPQSRLFSGKSFILGGSFSSTYKGADSRVKIGDLSASLISAMPPLAGLLRVPSLKTALMSDWSVKLDALAREAAPENVSNISGVPSWFLRVLRRVMELRGASSIREVWPNLEVFFHGGISFEPYRREYAEICGPEAGTPEGGTAGMRYFENYNASEGFFAAQNSAGPGRRPMRLLLNIGVYYEFLPLNSDTPLNVAQIEAGKVYELIVTSCNGLWRYRLGDTVRIESLSPLTITMEGRTKSFINAFGEELMEANAEEGMARACSETGATVANYTAAPVYAHGSRRGCHQWLIEWSTPPENVDAFAEALDRVLCELNSDYDAKRSHTIFLDPPQIVPIPAGTFDRWLSSAGNHKLGGQRKIPRLSNDRHIADDILRLLNNIAPKSL
ncbi:MAG: GH3 auxin-responsive promoter family protein [Clostridium sp.]|nr:GH3 auxin-responsive promoter family protein [Prevotella sp.]MCM1429064.1 GH3 auxin-responsive promoter family protein [Clostridium sp.]MCM1475405.1 GH3 auxin-responsive promoter family protein [Muribaculaceae bacterium]